MSPTSTSPGHRRGHVAIGWLPIALVIAAASCGGGDVVEEMVDEETLVAAVLGYEQCVERTVTLRAPASATNALDEMRDAERVALYPIALVLGVQFSPNQNDCRGENGTRPWERCVFPSSERSGAAPGTSIVSTERVMLLDPGCSARSSFRAQCVEGGGRLEDASPEPCSEPDPPPESPESSRSAPFASGTLPSRIDVRVDTHDVRGELSRAAVLLGLRAHIADLRLCYEQALVSDATVAGTVRLAFIVSPTGSVNTANIGADDLSDPRVGRCIAEAARHWTFSPPDGGGLAGVNADITFASNGAAL
jgi:hypothetical protein